MDHKEKRFESDIETYLLASGGYTKGLMASYDAEKAIDLSKLVEFIKATQPNEWQAYNRTYPKDPIAHLYKRLTEEINTNGLIHVLRNGIKDRGISLKLCYFKPSSNLNIELVNKYNSNILTCTRQFTYSAQNRNSIDMVLSLNGIPIVAIELKNQLTGQSIENAKTQYMYDRDPRETCFHINKRFLVYFAVDLYEIVMTTKLAGRDTIFLPFNQGSGGAGEVGGAGNPQNLNGYTTSYLWEKVLKKDSLLSIIQQFIHASQKSVKVLAKDGKESIKKTDHLIFPRYHQLDVVTKMIEDIKLRGSGQNYLIQHSAGSGKSNSIAWLCHRLANIQDDKNQPIFTCIIVVTDRRVLDSQLQETISSFDHVFGMVETIGDKKTSQDLKNAINDGKKIIVTTLQKFPVIYEEVDDTSGKRFAVIVDEAHSSQTGRSAQKLKEALADTQQALEEFALVENNEENAMSDTEDELVKELLHHGRHQNLSFFAFTATPKQKTLEIFGERQADGSFKPFHIYSMRQAIEEGFIHDVLLNYKTYKMCVKIAKNTPENPELPESEALKAIKRYESLHPYNLQQKTEIIVEYFREITSQKINHKAKAMIVTASRLHAVRYFQEMKRYISKKAYHDLDILVAFSGSIKDGNTEYSESDLNQTKSGQKISENQLPEYFHSDDFNMLIVAEKYQTGFDEPLLHTMFVDKKLSGVKAVQTLSRLNRTTKGKNDTVIIDFVNSAKDIQDAFQPFFESTLLDEEINVNLIYTTKAVIRSFGFYNDQDLNKFNQIYYQGTQNSTALGKITSLLTPIQNHYLNLSEEDQFKFKKNVRNFVKWYTYITQITRMFDRELQREFNFLRYLEKVLPMKPAEKVNLDDKIKLEFYKLEKTFEGQIPLEKNTNQGILKNSKSVDTSKKDPKEELLDQIIDRINQEFVGLISEMDRVIISTLYEKTINHQQLKNQAKNNDFKMFFESSFRNVFGNIAEKCYEEQVNAFTKLFQNSDFYTSVMAELARETYHTLRNSSQDQIKN